MQSRDVKQPIIGVAPFRKIQGGRELLGTAEGSEIDYTQLPADKYKGTSKLNKDHTHFFLVDDGGRSKVGWGSELELKAKLESDYARLMGMPIVQLCVQGGPGAIQNLYKSGSNPACCSAAWAPSDYLLSPLQVRVDKGPNPMRRRRAVWRSLH